MIPPPPQSTFSAQRLRRLERLGRTLDYAIRVPGTRFRFGLDGIIGLIPGVGDVAGAALSSFIVWEAVRMGASKALVARMLANVGLEMLVGTVPVVGDVFDFAWKANRRNVELLKRHLVSR